MTTESETSQQQQTDEKAAQAAFAASFTEEAPKATPGPTPEPTAPPQAEPSATPEPEKQEEAAPPAPSPEPTPAPYDAQAAIRKLQGQIGDLNSLLREQMKKKEEAGKPTTVTAVELRRMKEQFPELAEFLQEDLAESLAALAPKAPDPTEVQGLIEKGVSQGVAQQMAVMREQIVTDSHANWKTDLWQDGQLGTQRTADYAAWLKSMPPEQAKAFEESENPFYVAKRIAEFYEWRDQAAKAKQQQQDRLKAGITPKGVPRAGQPTMSDEEALRKGFEAGFNS